VFSAVDDLLVPVNYGDSWIGTSPFVDPITQQEGNALHLQVSEYIDTYLSAAGMIRCTKGAWMWLPWDTGTAIP
jgi:hypothetical protein